MAQARKVDASKSDGEEEAAPVASSSSHTCTNKSNLTNDVEKSPRTTQARDDDTTPTTSKSNFPMRDTSSSCRTASSNWVAGKTVGIAGNMSPEEIFGEGEDLVPMPLEESVFSSEAGEQFKLGDTPIANEVYGDATATVTGGAEGERGVASPSVPSIVDSKIAAVAPKTTTAACATSGPSKGKDINSLTKYRKRKAEYLEESASILVDVDEFLQRGDHASKYNDYELFAGTCEEPTDRDVLLGRGGLTNHHKGNKLYREKIEAFKPYYQKLSSKDEKQEFSMCVVNFIHGYGGRFLEKDVYSDGWVEVEKNKARKKVGQALRETLKH